MRRVVPRDILERLTPGDLVVHIDHGIARYERMLRRGGAGEERDYLELSFAGGDRIFVPVEQIDRVSRYSGGERPAAQPARRDRVAAHEAAGQARRRRPRRGAARALRGPERRPRATPSPPDTPWQSEMEASFPYEETVDQLRAVAEMKLDMEAAPADGPARRRRRRLRQDRGRAPGRLQGDPGRHAGRRPRPDDRPRRPALRDVRAALRGVPDERPAPLAVRPGAASRRRPSRGSADGSVDLVIGTHRLLSKDVRFRDLGLVVVDEEQRFGVAAKERLKRLRQRGRRPDPVGHARSRGRSTWPSPGSAT